MKWLWICSVFIPIIIIPGISTGNEVVIKTKIYCDHCVECPTCKPLIEHELSFEKGVKRVKLNVELQEIHIVYNPTKTDVQKLRLAINNLGYDADDTIAPEEKVNKLDECCKKPQKN